MGEGKTEGQLPQKKRRRKRSKRSRTKPQLEGLKTRRRRGKRGSPKQRSHESPLLSPGSQLFADGTPEQQKRKRSKTGFGGMDEGRGSSLIPEALFSSADYTRSRQ